MVFTINRKEEAACRPKQEFTPKTLADLNIDGISDVGYNGGRFSPDSFTSSHSSHSHRSRNKPPIQQQPTPSLYSSQQNLSSNSNFSNTNRQHHYQQQYINTKHNNHNNNNNNSHNHSSFSRNGKLYGSTSNIAVLERNLNSTSFAVPKNVHNSGSTSSSTSSHNTPSLNNQNVDNWLNAWDHPAPQVPSAPIAAKRTQFSLPVNNQVLNANANNNNFNHNQNHMYNKSAISSLPIKPLPAPHSNRRVNNDPWSGLAFLFSFYFILIFFLYNFWEFVALQKIFWKRLFNLIYKKAGFQKDFLQCLGKRVTLLLCIFFGIFQLFTKKTFNNHKYARENALLIIFCIAFVSFQYTFIRFLKNH